LQDIQRVATPFRIRSIKIRAVLNGKNNLKRAKKKRLMHQNRVFKESIRKEATPMSVFNTTFDVINMFSSSRLQSATRCPPLVIVLYIPVLSDIFNREYPVQYWV